MSNNLNQEELKNLQTLTQEFNKIKTQLGDLELQKHGFFEEGIDAPAKRPPHLPTSICEIVPRLLVRARRNPTYGKYCCGTSRLGCESLPPKLPRLYARM